eukprot:TRINITY_DN32101_c0_g1_i1.p1 TRINITY_DN32101_c0_g1~~TRINITY_DN32101_c0_g1_i1.p1  ORF type:complete len:367 (+),score=69.86 TRINITY_DN32101_c0_g1_i1:32-1102(+)
MAKEPARFAVPPQVCSLALALNGLSGLCGHWARITAYDVTPLPLLLLLLAASVLALYASNLLRCPQAVWQDLGNTASLPALNAFQATMSALTARFGPGLIADPMRLQACLTALHILGLGISTRFLMLCYSKGQWPDPSWFPAVLLPLMGYASSQAVGPWFLKAPEQFLAWTVLMAIILVSVTYRLFLSPTRDSVAPHAGMSLLMAPCSFFCMAYLATGKPYGDVLGLVLFGASTAWFLMTLLLLYTRRQLWSGAFHPSYVSFTFPMASTATAALLASERLPQVASTASQAWALLLSLAAAFVVLSVLVRFSVFMLGQYRASLQQGKTSGKPSASASSEEVRPMPEAKKDATQKKAN